MSLAEVTDLELVLGYDLEGSDVGRGQRLLDDASAAVVSYTGQTFVRAETTATVRVPPSRWLRLGQRPVHSVSAVTDVNDNELTFTFDGLDRVRIPANLSDFAWEPWPTSLRTAKVTYDHGYDQIPGDVIAVVCQMAARAYGVNPADAGVNNERIGEYSYGIGAAASSGAVGMLLPERSILDRYRTPARTVSVNT